MNKKIVYPGKRPFAICLTHDIDRTKKTYQCGYYFFKEIIRCNIKNAFYHLTSYFNNPYWTFNEIMDLEKKHTVRSTFFFLQEEKKFPLNIREFMLFVGRYNVEDKEIQGLIREIDNNGWELGVHGSYNSYKNLTLLASQKKRLERIVNHPIKGVRQHYLNFDFEKTWVLQKKAGFKYDSSFGLNRGIGFKDRTRKVPFNPFSISDNKFMVFPIALMDSALPHQLINTKELWNKIISLYDEAEEKGFPLVIIWHNTSFSKQDYPGYFELYENMIIEGKKREAWFCTLGELYDFLNATKTNPPKRFSKKEKFKSSLNR